MKRSLSWCRAYVENFWPTEGSYLSESVHASATR